MLIMKKSRLLAKRSPIKPKPRASRPNQYWGTDMTKVTVGSFDWIYIHVVLDWYTKEIVGHSFSFQSKANDWLDSLKMSVSQPQRNL